MNTFEIVCGEGSRTAHDGDLSILTGKAHSEPQLSLPSLIGDLKSAGFFEYDFATQTPTEGEEVMSLKQKLIGNPGTEIPQAGYMVAARQLVRHVMHYATAFYVSVMNKPGGWFSRLLARRRARRLAEGARFFLESDVGRAFVSFGLAAVVQAFPLKGFTDQRQKLAYMLRLDAYSVVGDKVVDTIVKPFESELISALKRAEEDEGEQAEIIDMPEAQAN